VIYSTCSDACIDLSCLGHQLFTACQRMYSDQCDTYDDPQWTSMQKLNSLLRLHEEDCISRYDVVPCVNLMLTVPAVGLPYLAVLTCSRIFYARTCAHWLLCTMCLS